MTPSQRRALLGPVLVEITMVAGVISSLGAPLIATIARQFHESLSVVQWSLTVALLSGAISSPVMGRLGDGRRRREAMIGALLIVTAGGVVSAVAPNLTLLIVGRGMQGVGLGLAPLAMAAARDEMPADKVPSMIGVLSVSSAAGVGLGYPVSGLVADTWGLGGAFWFGTIVTAVALIGVAVVVPSNSASGRPSRLDWLGTALLATALVAVLVGLAQGEDWGWGSVRIVALLVGGVVLFVVWAFHQIRTEAPLVDLRLVRHPEVLAGDACAVVLGISMYMSLSAVTDFVQAPRSSGYGFAASVVVAGLVLVPLCVLMMAGSRALPMLVARLGLKSVLAAGSVVTGAGSAYFAVAHVALWEAFVTMGLLGIGLGATFAAIPGLIVRAVPAHETGSAMGFYQVVRYIGFSVGSALAASILASRSAGGHEPALGGYTTLLWISAAVCVVAAVLAVVLPAGRTTVDPVEALPEEAVRMLEETEGDGYLAHSG